MTLTAPSTTPPALSQSSISTSITREEWGRSEYFSDDGVDMSMAAMNLALGSIQAVETLPGTDAERDETRNMWFAGIGTAGPAVVGGAMLIMNKIAIALFVGLGPLFILCLLFDATKNLFQRWLLYGVGTLFSLAVLYVMVHMALDLTLAVTASYWISDTLLDDIGAQGMNNMATMQGGLGIIMTLLLITVPMMAANFFSGTLGNFMHYSAFGAGAAAAPSAHGPAGAPYRPMAPELRSGITEGVQGEGGRGAFGSQATPTHAVGPAGGSPTPIKEEVPRRV